MGVPPFQEAPISYNQNCEYNLRFPEIGVAPNHPFVDGIFPYKPTSYWGTPMAMETSKLSIAVLNPYFTEVLLVLLEGEVGLINGYNYDKNFWGFPKIGVAPNHPFLDGIFSINHPFGEGRRVTLPI